MALTLKDLENIIWRATMMVLGLDPDDESQEIQKQVRLSWPLSETGNPNWERTESTTFIRITPANDSLSTTTDISYTDDGIERHRYYRCYNVNYIVYGDSAFETGDRLKDGLLRQPIREFLALNDLAWVSGIPDTMQTNEQDATGEWWHRYDLQVQLYELAQRDYPVDTYIGAMPDITIKAGGNS